MAGGRSRVPRAASAGIRRAADRGGLQDRPPGDRGGVAGEGARVLRGPAGDEGFGARDGGGRAGARSHASGGSGAPRTAGAHCARLGSWALSREARRGSASRGFAGARPGSRRGAPARSRGEAAQRTPRRSGRPYLRVCAPGLHGRRFAGTDSGEPKLKAEIGIIGGSGLYSMPGFEAQEEASLQTPWGSPSDNYVLGNLAGRRVAFLARHGRGHRLAPSELNFRANIYGMKSLGVERILSLSAVGSLKEEHHPLEFVIPDQFFDRTNGRGSTFFGEGLVAHISFADPICPQLAGVVHGACQTVGVNAKMGGTYLCMEGPAFSTKAESEVYRSWGMDVIGMTNVQEAKLAREAEICYVTIAMVTDYDIIANLTKNAEHACRVVREAVARMPNGRACQCGSALAHAMITDQKTIPETTRKKLDLLIGKYMV